MEAQSGQRLQRREKTTDNKHNMSPHRWCVARTPMLSTIFFYGPLKWTALIQQFPGAQTTQSALCRSFTFSHSHTRSCTNGTRGAETRPSGAILGVSTFPEDTSSGGLEELGTETADLPSHRRLLKTECPRWPAGRRSSYHFLKSVYIPAELLVPRAT